MRNPNGYGSVVKLSGNRRNPFHIRKTVGFNGKGHPVYQTLGYTKTREEGMILLAQYNKQPWDINTANMTLEELFTLWLEKKYPKLGKSNQNALKSAYTKHCKSLHSRKYTEIKAYHMQEMIDNCGCGYSTQAAIKMLWSHLDKFALELDISKNNYSCLLKSDPIPETDKEIFSEEEIQVLWGMQDVSWVDSVLFFIYSGWRISELLELTTDSVDLENGTITGGKKTAAGKNRVVPIHSKVRHIVERRLNESDEYLFSHNGKKCSAESYRTFWSGIMAKAKMKHTPHECRHTFRSRLDSAGANKKCIDLMMGHKSQDIGERVYTKKSVDELKSAIEKIA